MVIKDIIMMAAGLIYASDIAKYLYKSDYLRKYKV
ncbi:hypothetical protein [Dyadobacter sp. CY345]|nr:hypothetical protein [Dyadobacter sp. CY345]